MSRSKGGRTGGRGTGTARQNKPYMREQLTIQEKPTTNKAFFSTLFGVGVVVVVVIGFAVMAMIGHAGNGKTATASGGGTVTVPVGYGSLNHAKGACGNAGQAACPAVDPGWFSISIESPTAIATAITKSSDYAGIVSHYGCAALDTPVLVHAYDAHTGNSYYDDDHWVVSARNATGMRCGIFDFVYDRTQQRLRFSSYGVLTAQDPHSALAFPYTSSVTAIAALQSQRKLGVMAGTQPELMFFPIDPSFPVLTSPVHKWAGGGNSAMNAMWHIVGADRHDYFVGTDLHVYVQQDLPIAKGQP